MITNFCMKTILLAIAITASISAMAQDSTGSLSFSGYVEAYYQYDFNKPADNTRPSFVYSHNRHNEFTVNLAFIKMAYAASKARANVALAAGTYTNANYAAEPGVLKNLMEANVGVKLGRKNLWLDAGIFSSHIGFESAISKDCRTLTRSIVADNTPYFEAGAKITYTSTNEKWLFSLLALNGWQRITRVPGNSLMNWGTQVQFKPSANIVLNYSTFIGTDKPDSARLNRLYHNCYGIFSLTKQSELTLGFDIGTEQKTPGSNQHNTVLSPVLIYAYSINDKWSVAARAEYYQDKNGVIIATGTPNGFKTTGFSANIDHHPVKNLWVRLECRILHSKDRIFTKDNNITNTNPFITGSIALAF